MIRCLIPCLSTLLLLGVLDASATPLRYCGDESTACLPRAHDRDQIEAVSKRFLVDLAPLRRSIAQTVRKSMEEIESIWVIAVGPPKSSVVVALVEGSFVAFLVNESIGKLQRLTFSPALSLVHRRDIRAVAPVDMLRDGGRQLLFVADTMAGSGLGQASISVYRLQGVTLQGVFSDALDENTLIGDSGDYADVTNTSFTWLPPSPKEGVTAAILATRTHTLGRAKAKRAIRHEWNGSQFAPVEQPGERAAQKREADRFEVELRRIHRELGMGSQ